MKKSAIRDIFNGLKGHRESISMMQGNRKNLSIACDAYDELKEKISPNLFELHQRFIDALENNWLEEIDSYFVEGFKLGLLIGIECAEDS